MVDRFREAFREEADELLNNLELSLLALEERPDDEESISAVFRAMHTIKGSASMFGFDTVSEFAHEVESALEHVRNGSLTVSQQLIDLTLSARDIIREMLHSDELTADHQSEAHMIVDRFRAIVAGVVRKPPAGRAGEGAVFSAKAVDRVTVGAVDTPAESVERTFRIRFRPRPNLLLNGTNPVLLLKELREIGFATVIPYLDLLPPVADFNAEYCYLHWDVFLTTKAGLVDVQDVFTFVTDTADIDVRVIDELTDVDDDNYRRIGQILVDRGVVDSSHINQVLGKQKRLGQILVEEGIPAQEVRGALEEQQHVTRSRERVQAELSQSSIRVQSTKIDALVDLVGELVTLQARLSQTASEVQHAGLAAITESFDRLTSELRDGTMSIRMVPIGTTFSKFKRLVRDLSQELGKEVDLVTEGGDTELDKTVIERLSDPLVHIIRNSIDHGVESPDDRVAAGKRRGGLVRLSASQSGASIIIAISDDGAGINAERVRAKAERLGIIGPGEDLSEQEINHLIFAPGFSTAEHVTKVSGRGVGMDVVKREIDSLGGSIDVRSVAGGGTTLALRIPLTLAIVEGLLVKVASERYVFPLSTVEECIELNAKNRVEGRNIIENRGHPLPFVRLRSVFEFDADHPEIEQMVVVPLDDGSMGFVVDNVIGQHQTVIKGLGRAFRNLDGISGATILGDGDIALIIDAPKIAAMAKKQGSDTRMRDRDRLDSTAGGVRV